MYLPAHRTRESRKTNTGLHGTVSVERSIGCLPRHALGQLLYGSLAGHAGRVRRRLPRVNRQFLIGHPKLDPTDHEILFLGSQAAETSFVLRLVLPRHGDVERGLAHSRPIVDSVQLLLPVREVPDVGAHTVQYRGLEIP